MSDTMAAPVSDATTPSVTGLMRTTQDAIQDGIADARASVEEAWPKVVQTLNKGVYNTAYGLAFGVVFPIMLVAKVVPQDNCVVWGFIDGAKAAKSAANRSSTAT